MSVSVGRDWLMLFRNIFWTIVTTPLPPWCFISSKHSARDINWASSRAASSKPSRGNYGGEERPSENNQLWLYRKTCRKQQVLYVCAQTHTHTYTLTTISRSHSWCYQVTLRHCFWFLLSQHFNSHLERKYHAWNETLGLGANYFCTGESDFSSNTKKWSSLNAAFQWQNQLFSTLRG